VAVLKSTCRGRTGGGIVSVCLRVSTMLGPIVNLGERSWMVCGKSSL